jgi:transcriptional/translational regulatory protein YebC/TACO1
MRPSTQIELDEDGVGKVLKLIEALEDLDDVGAVHANFEADADVLERAAAA